MSEFVSAVQVVVELPLANCTMESRFVHYIIANHDVINKALQASLDLRYQNFQDRYSKFSTLVCACSPQKLLCIQQRRLGGGVM
jgi:hypothetical protein